MGRVVAAIVATLSLAACGWGGPVVERHTFTTGFKAGKTIQIRVHTRVTGSLALGAQSLPLSSDQILTQQPAG